MPSIVDPKNDEARSRLLEKSGKASEKHPGLLSQKIVEDVNAFVPQFRVQMVTTDDKLNDRIEANINKNEKVKNMKKHVRQTWSEVKKQVNYTGVSTAVFAFYNMNQKGIIPKISNESSWFDATKKVIDGSKKAVEKGYPPVVNPTVDVLETSYTEANDMVDTAKNKDLEFDIAQDDLGVMRNKAENFIFEIKKALVYKLRRKNAPSRRRVMRDFGFRFSNDGPDDSDSDSPDSPNNNSNPKSA